MNRPGWTAAVTLMLLIAANGTAIAGATSLGGMTGLLNIPVAAVAPEGTFHLGYNLIDRDQSYEGRGTLDNRVYFLTMGFLPRTEVSIRATVLPGESHIEGLEADGVDRMGSGRILLLEEATAESPGRSDWLSWPAVAVGMDDLKGTRRYHSLYCVATKSIRRREAGLGGSISAGYGFRTFRAGRYLLDGEFGGADIYFGKWVDFIVEYDSEKWNGGLRLFPAFPLTAQLALLNFETPSGGVAWTHRF